MFLEKLLILIAFLATFTNADLTEIKKSPSMDLNFNNFNRTMENNSLIFVKFYSEW